METGQNGFHRPTAPKQFVAMGIRYLKEIAPTRCQLLMVQIVVEMTS